MMKINVLTLFPEMFEAVLGESIIGRAGRKGLIDLNYINIRDYSKDKHRRVDDYPYGAGGGMVMAPQPIYDAYMSIAEKLEHKPHVVYMSPQGSVFTQEKAAELAGFDNIVFLCGHYEGVDERILEEIVDEEISVGDYVLTGGEIPAMAVIDAIARMVPGVVQNGNSETESHTGGLLEYPQYTRPPEFMGKKVPDILLSGNHAEINKWRKQKSLERTEQKRPDMYKKYINNPLNMINQKTKKGRQLGKDMFVMNEIRNEVKKAFEELCEAAQLKKGQIAVLGCSTSEIAGSRIGKGSVYEIGEEVIDGALEVLNSKGIYLAVGCCEHLNRAVVIEREAAEKYGFEIVSVIPQVKAGGSAGTAAYKKFKDPCVVEFVKGHAGMDIGDTFIGMHLRHVAVPVRLSMKSIGEAHVTFAKTRPKYIGGERAVYTK